LGVGHRVNNPIPENIHVTETATKENNTTRCDGLPEASQDPHMNVSVESRKETNNRKIEVLSAKTKTRISFWNTRTMYETGKLAQVTAEMRRYNLHILEISESRWTGSGRYRRKPVPFQTGFVICSVDNRQIN